MTIIFLWLFLTVPLVDLQCVIVIFPDHTHFFVKIVKNRYPQILRGNVILRFIMHYKSWVMSQENLLLLHANNKGIYQPIYLHSMISPFVICSLQNIKSKLASWKVFKI